jgi:outer membrane PBP1 activator LpoA protein
MTRVRAAWPGWFALAISMVASWPALSLPEVAAATNAVIAAPTDAPSPPAAPPPSPRAAAIALVLPLESSDYGRAADAVRAGFLAAAAVANVKPLVFAHGDGGVQEAFTKARAAGARVIVGPLLRDDVKWLALTTDPLPWTIALNQLDDTQTVSDRIIALGLSVESEARQIARRVAADNAQSVAVVTADTPLSKRFASAFIAEWLLQGGGPPVDMRLERSREGLAALKSDIVKKRIDAIVLAVDANDAAVAKPYLGQAPVYAGSQVNDRLSPAAMRDLDDVRFVEIPWLADPDGAQYASIERRDYPSPVFERLYALGIDAFRVAEVFADGAPREIEFDGATGHLTLDASRQFNRDGKLMQFRGGQIVPLD